MLKENTNKRKLSIFTYFLILSCVIGITVLLIKELNISTDFEDILYQKDVETHVEQENKYYVNKIKDEYGISIMFGENERGFLSSVDANIQYDTNIINNNIKVIYNALRKYPSDVFNIFKNEKYNLYIMLVSDFNDNNIALASKNSLNQYRIYLSNNEKFERAFHHEFFHVLEYYMSERVKYLYHSWNTYNPLDFKYETNVNKLTDEGVYYKYLTEEQIKNTYFVTKYSKVSEKEDRAEIFAELMVLNKNEGFLRKDSNIRKKIDYLINEIHENVSIMNFYFSNYLT